MRTLRRKVVGVLAAVLGGATLVALLPGCAGPPVVTEVKGEPICPDFNLGATDSKMKGGLRYPVQLKIFDDDGDVLQRLLLTGRRSEETLPLQYQLLDDNDEHPVQWMQCGNTRSPRPIEDHARKSNVTEYNCNHGALYASQALVLVKGDPSSHELTMPPPPDPTCWGTEDESEEDAETDTETGTDTETETGTATDTGEDAEGAGEGGSAADASAPDASAAPSASAVAKPPVTAPKAGPSEPPKVPPAPPKAPPPTAAPPPAAPPPAAP